MTITVAPNAQEPPSEDQYFLLKALGLIDPEDDPNNPAGGGTRRWTETRYEISRQKGDNIEYGNAIEINAKNLDKLGLSDERNGIVTYDMDQDGNLVYDEMFDATEINAEGFLLTQDSDVTGWDYNHNSDEYTITSMKNGEDPAFMLRPVKVDGMLQGYFVHGKDDNLETGAYLDASAIDVANLPDEMKAELFADPPKEPVEQTLQNNFEISDPTVATALKF